MEEKLDTVDSRLARIAARQHGVATISQIHGVGWNKNAVSRAVREGRLHRLHRGVYAVGHRAPSREREWVAAVLACGEGAVLSHGSAAALWGLLRPIDSDDVDGRGSLVTVRTRIPVARTIEDLRGTVPPNLVRRATRQAELAGYRVGGGAKPRRTRSDLEDDFLTFCERHALPRPEVNVKVGRFEVDFVWRLQGVAVETDDFRYHRGSVAFEDDHARDLELRRRGLAVRRFTGQQLDEQPGLVAADLRQALAGHRIG